MTLSIHPQTGAPDPARVLFCGGLGVAPESIRSLAMKSMFERLEGLCEGALAVNLEGCIVWINEKYAHKLGLPSAAAAIGLRVEDLIPHSQLREVARTGQPIMLDIMAFGDEHLVVTRMPIRDNAGQLVGAVGFVLYNRLEGLKPMMGKMAQLQSQLTAAEKELADNRRAKYSLASFLGISAVAVETKRQARRAAQLDTTVLLVGETGTGKELLAHAIHNASPRARKPFVSINAAAIPEALLEAELFGAAPGAYTGADRRGRDGKFKLADGGTLFLDEIGDMPSALQAKLLRVLQEQEIEPLGANRLVRIDVRVIAATSLDLQARVAQGLFRSDLYYRLNVLAMLLPPLRTRFEDLPLLVERILEDVSLRIGQPLEIDTEAIAILAQHHWPGNVRELHNVVERALLMHETQRLTAAHLASVLPASLQSGVESSLGSNDSIPTLASVVNHAERQAIQGALLRTKGNKVAAAQALGISRAALYQKLGVQR